LSDIRLSKVKTANARKAMPQISARSAAERLIGGPDGVRLRDRLLDELDLDLDRLLLERVLDGLRLIVLRLAIAQMFSLMPLLYHM
jgi:hypothetical protein